VVSGADAALRELGERVQLVIIGSVSGGQLTIIAGEARIELSLEALREAHGALAALFG